MTAALATPQQIRDRLLQAIDTQSNICNMVAVLEVITSLEKYPITKEALEETRLGKLINDVRKKTTNEDLAKRAKKLLRNWQKLIEPVVQNEPLPRPNPPGSANGGALNCKPEVQSPLTPGGTKPIQELKTRNDIQNLSSPKEKLGNRKRKGDLKDGVQGPPLKISKPNYEQVQNCSPVPSNGVGGSPGGFPSVRDMTSANAHNSPERNLFEHVENDKHCKIPVNAVKPHTSSPGLVKISSTSSLLKTSLLQQLEKSEETSGQYQPRSPRCPSFSPRNIKQDSSVKRQTTYAPKGTVSSPSPLSDSYVPSPLPLTQPSTPPVSAKKLESSQLQTESEMPAHCLGHVDVESPHRPSTGTLQPNTPLHSSHSSKMGLHQGEPLTPHISGYTPDASKGDSDDAASGSDSKKKKYLPRDHRTNVEERTVEGKKPSVKLKERKLTFDHITRQIIPLTNKEPSQVSSSAPDVQHRTEPERPETKVPPQSPFEQTNWKELSKNGIIASYLNRQSNLLSTSGAQTPGAHYFMSEYLKQEESTRREARKTGILLSSTPVDLPGVSNEITDDNLRKVHEQHWSGVNGCYDTQGNWYDWTHCISVDPHGDDGRLNILPYVCLD